MTGAYIVIAEDDEPSRVLLTTFLTERGYLVGVAADGMQALGLIRERTPDMVITDVNMPEMNGLELVRRLRAHHKLAGIPVIMLSALTASQQVLAGYAEGADDYQVKPIDLAVLGAKVDALLARAHQAQQPQGAGKVILFVHTKGGVGATTIAVNLASVLAPLSLTPVSILDLKLGFGDVAPQLGLRPRLSLADLSLQPIEVLDEQLFSKFIEAGSAGVQVVVGAHRPEHGELVTVPAVQTAIARLQQRSQYVLIDAPWSAREQAMAALDAADMVCVVTNQSRLALISTAELLKLFGRIDVPARRQLVILNLNRPEAVNQDVQAILGRRADLTVAYSQELLESTEFDAPLGVTQPNAEALTTLREFAAGLGDRLARASTDTSRPVS